MDITWSAIGKLLVAGLGTYVFLPAALVLRDFVLWQFIRAYSLNSKLRDQITRYAVLVNTWNSNYAVDKTIERKEGKTACAIKGKEVSLQEWTNHLEASNKLSNSIEETELFIRRKSKFLNYLIKHYKQDTTNPIDEWVKNEGSTRKRVGSFV